MSKLDKPKISEKLDKETRKRVEEQQWHTIEKWLDKRPQPKKQDNESQSIVSRGSKKPLPKLMKRINELAIPRNSAIKADTSKIKNHKTQGARIELKVWK